MSKILLIAHNTFREAIRNKVLYSILLFAILLVAISAFFGSVSIGSQERVIKDFGLFSLSFFGTIITILSGTTLLNKEIKQKTIYNILSKPLPRWQFILGKHLGLSATVSILVLAMGLGLIGFVACFEGQVDWLLFQALYFIVLEVIVVAAIAIFFSSVVITTTLTGIFTLGFYIAGRSIAYLTYFVASPDNTTPALTIVVHVLNWVVPDLSVFSVQDQIVYGHAASNEQFLFALLYAFSYSAIVLFLAALVFERRELT